jgi:hypothetical protein
MGNDRHAAVAQAVKLGETAGFESRRDDDGVAAGLHQMRHRLVVTNRDADAAGMAGGGGEQRTFEGRIAGAQDGELAAHGDDLVGGGRDQVHALLPGQAADDAEDRGAVLVEAEELGDGMAVFGAALQRGGGVMGVDDGIGGRVPDVGVDAVDDAVQRLEPAGDDAFQPHAEFRVGISVA